MMVSHENLRRPLSPPTRVIATRSPEAAFAASLVELPGSHMDTGEKEAVSVGFAPSVRTMTSCDTLDVSSQLGYSSRSSPHALDSVIELPGSIPKNKSRDSLRMAELPGSTPHIMEKDAGPLPPVELPATVPEE